MPDNEAKKKKKAQKEEKPDEVSENDDEDNEPPKEEKKKKEGLEKVQVFVGRRLAGRHPRKHVFLRARGRDRLLPLLWHQGAGFGRCHPRSARRFWRRCRK